MVRLNAVVVRYGELALKGKNRKVFERRLVNNIRDCMRKHGSGVERIERPRGRINIHTKSNCDALGRVFGIASFSCATGLLYSSQGLKDCIDKMLSGRKFQTFRVSASRIDRSVPVSSRQINIEIGQHVVDKYDKQVALSGHDLDIGIELIKGRAYVFLEKTPGPGGLPYGVNGRAAALIEDENSLLAAWLMMRRGIRAYPFSKTKKDISALKKYSYGCKMQLDTERPRGPGALIVNDTARTIRQHGRSLLVLRPLVGFVDEEISERLKYIKEHTKAIKKRAKSKS
jgi:thiamine biosynthesis protein ThiI